MLWLGQLAQAPGIPGGWQWGFPTVALGGLEEEKLSSPGPIFPVQRPSLRMWARVRSVPTLPVPDAKVLLPTAFLPDPPGKFFSAREAYHVTLSAAGFQFSPAQLMGVRWVTSELTEIHVQL